MGSSENCTLCLTVIFAILLASAQTHELDPYKQGKAVHQLPRQIRQGSYSQFLKTTADGSKALRWEQPSYIVIV